TGMSFTSPAAPGQGNLRAPRSVMEAVDLLEWGGVTLKVTRGGPAVPRELTPATVTLPKQQLEQLRVLAELLDMTRSSLIRAAVADYVAKRLGRREGKEGVAVAVTG